jgi:hypothetical protein
MARHPIEPMTLGNMRKLGVRWTTTRLGTQKQMKSSRRSSGAVDAD